MYKTIEQEYDSGKRGPGSGSTRIVSCEHLGKPVTGLQHHQSSSYIIFYADGTEDVVDGNTVVVHVAGGVMNK